MKVVKIGFGCFLALFALGFLINLGKSQRQFGSGAWTQLGRANAPTMLAAILLETGLYLLFFVLSLWGSIALFRSAAAYVGARVIEFSFGILLFLFAWFLGHMSAGDARSVEPLMVGFILALLEAAASVVLLRGTSKNRPTAKITKIILGVILALLSLLSILGVYEGLTLRHPPENFWPVVVFATFSLLEIGGSLALFVSAFVRIRLRET
jgi:hypothetical protein